jgi:hypothetical protein
MGTGIFKVLNAIQGQYGVALILPRIKGDDFLRGKPVP